MNYNEFIALRKLVIEKTFNKLNDMQKKAVFSTEGPLLVLAGAGSGKTTVLVNRIANIMRFGKAYSSSDVNLAPTDNDIKLVKAFLAGETQDLFDVEDLLSVDSPKPWQILAITFTNKAANEIKERLSSMLGQSAADIWAGTFHSACSRILRRNGDKTGFSNHFTIYDTDDSRRTMKECQRILNIDDKFLSHKVILKAISSAKDRLISPSEFLEQSGNDTRLKKIGEAYKQYQKLLRTADAMDFDDIIYNTVKLLENNKDIRKFYQDKFRYIMVDEYQDTNHAQYRLTSILAAKHRNICVVGDDDQSIYRFRGATVENILNFENEYSHSKVIRLEQNYRSTQTILDAANAVIENNGKRKGKNLWTSNNTGDKIVLYSADDEIGESRFIADTILNSRAQGRNWSDHAILYRMNAQSNYIENTFVRNGIPYRIIGGHRFYERKEIRDAVAYLTVINNPDDNIRLRRIINEPKRGIGDTTLNNVAGIADDLNISMFEIVKKADEYAKISRAASKLLSFARMIEEIQEMSEKMTLAELFEFTMKKSGYLEGLALDKEKYTERLLNLNELSSNLTRYSEENEEGDLNGFLEEIALMTDIDNYNAQADTVVMMTLHSSKGLEFPVVFIPGMEEGIFPGRQSIYSNEEIEEERRLAYVGITRAKKSLYLSNAKYRILYGSTNRNKQSRFIEEIPTQLIEMRGSSSSAVFSQGKGTYATIGERTRKSVGRGFSGVESKPKKPSVSYNIGEEVSHKTFGDGIVLSTRPMGNDTMLEIAFDKVGTKKIMANFAKIEKKQNME
ncbi:MAG TPA: UvrD-helicase domain-containing protein [Clostridia bacterium]|nr:UvrD-helicase domain-containing protein [Clostridia bacterium]